MKSLHVYSLTFSTDHGTSPEGHGLRSDPISVKVAAASPEDAHQVVNQLALEVYGVDRVNFIGGPSQLLSDVILADASPDPQPVDMPAEEIQAEPDAVPDDEPVVDVEPHSEG